MSSEEVKMKTGATHRPYDEAFKRAAVAQWQSGVPARRVAEGLGITTESLRTWRRQLGGADATLFLPLTYRPAPLGPDRAD